jgi:hypothetical protein
MAEPTVALSEFLLRYRQDDNEWWRLDCGDHQNIFDEAIERLETAEALIVADMEYRKSRQSPKQEIRHHFSDKRLAALKAYRDARREMAGGPTEADPPTSDTPHSEPPFTEPHGSDGTVGHSTPAVVPEIGLG